MEDILNGVAEADLVEDYPEYFKGPSVLVLQKDAKDLPIHLGNPERSGNAGGHCDQLPAADRQVV